MTRFFLSHGLTLQMFLGLLFSISILTGPASAISEQVRVEEHDKRYTRDWPPVEYIVPKTEGWKKLMTERLRQVAEIDNLNRRYEGYMQTITPAVVAPNFTEYGFGLVKGPSDLNEALREGIRGGYERGEVSRMINFAALLLMIILFYLHETQHCDYCRRDLKMRLK